MEIDMKMDENAITFTEGFYAGGARMP